MQKTFRFSFTAGFIWILLFLLTLCNGFLIWQNQNLKNEVQRLSAESKVQVGEDFSGFKAVDIDNKPVTLEAASKTKKIIFLFSTTCPFCKKQNSYWTELLKTFDASKYEVFAVFNRKEELKTVDEYFDTFGYKNAGTSIKVLFSEDETLEKYKLKSTPTTLVIDESDRVEKAWVGLWSPGVLAEANSFFNTSILKKELIKLPAQ